MFSDCLRAELDAAGHRADHDLPGCHRHQHRRTPPASTRPPARTSSGRRADAEADREDVRRRALRPRQGGQGDLSAVKKNKPIRPVAPEAYLLYGTSRVAPQALRSAARWKIV